MMRRAGCCALFLSPLILTILAVGAGLRFNRTHSFPLGFYLAIHKHPEKGDLVFFRPPVAPVFNLAVIRGYIGSGSLEPYEQMLKRLAAAEGDVVTIDDGGVTVNGQRLPNSAPRALDLGGRPLPVLRLDGYRLSRGEVLLMSDYSPTSFDSRYFGPIPRAQIQAVVRPVWTW
jgi:conjugative transfer signal peptidase TraF